MKITKKYSIKENKCNCHPETCCHWKYSLLKNGKVIDKDDYIKGLQFPSKNIMFKVLDLYGFQNHKKTKAYKKWKNE